MSTKLFNRNFTLLLFGLISSLFGNIILRFALSMYILEITGSAAIFASLLTISIIPTIVLSPFGGILADRANRRNIMVALDFTTGISILLFCFFLSENNAIIAIGVLLIILSILSAFESPTVQACVPQMQGGDNLIRANAMVNQVSAVAGLVAPILGSVFYTMFGIYPILIISVICFLATALIECFIQLEYFPSNKRSGILSIIKDDFSASIHFITKEKPDILKLLLLVAVINSFVAGIAVVGMPFMIRNILGLDATYYGAAESALGAAAIAGSIAAGFLVMKLKLQKLYVLLAIFGITLLPAGLTFLFNAPVIISYAAIILSFVLSQISAVIFSVFALSIIQQQTPNDMLGKIMSYVATITMCAQPLGQIAYGILFDLLNNKPYYILIPTSIIIFFIGLFSKNLFSRFEN